MSVFEEKNVSIFLVQIKIVAYLKLLTHLIGNI